MCTYNLIRAMSKSQLRNNKPNIDLVLLILAVEVPCLGTVVRFYRKTLICILLYMPPKRHNKPTVAASKPKQIVSYSH